MERKKWFPLAKQPIFISQNEGYASKIHFQFLENRSNNGLQIIESESALTNQNAGLVYKYVSVRQKNIAISGRQEYPKIEEKWFPLARKSVSTSRYKVIFQKIYLRKQKNIFK